MIRVTVKLSHWIILNTGQSKTLTSSYTFEVEHTGDEQSIYSSALELFDRDFTRSKEEGKYPHTDIAQIALKDQSFTIND